MQGEGSWDIRWRGCKYPCNRKWIFLFADDYVCLLSFRNTSISLSLKQSGTHTYCMILYLPEFITKTIPSQLIFVPSPMTCTLRSFPSVLGLSCSISPCTASSQIDLHPPTVSQVILLSNVKQCLFPPAEQSSNDLFYLTSLLAQPRR